MNDRITLEHELTDAAYDRIRALMKTRAGIELGPGKRTLVHGRLARRLRQLGLASFDQYLQHIEDEHGEEARRFLNALTTNVTEFFREPHHFEQLAREVLPALFREHAHDRRIRIWSAGCSTGEEPYSIAMVVSELLPHEPGWDVKILATDIDSDVLAHASAGVYPVARVERIERERLQRWFMKGTGKQEGFARVRDELRGMVTWRQLNLLAPWPLRGPFDVIFCRNVVIYFDTETRNRLIARYADILTPTGHLFVGHSESLVQSTAPLAVCGRTVYRKRPTLGSQS